MPPKPPAGKGTAVASTRIPGGVIIAAVAVFVLLFVLIFALSLSGVWDSLGPARYLIVGVLGAGAVLVPRYFRYEAGEDWFRRGDSWVDTTCLSSVYVERDTLKLHGHTHRQKTSVPLRVLRENPALFEALAAGVRRSHAQSGLELDESARAVFSIAGGRRQ